MSNKDRFTRESDKRFTLRIDKELFKKIEISAKNNKRAIGREIEFALEKYIEKISNDENNQSNK